MHAIFGGLYAQANYSKIYITVTEWKFLTDTGFKLQFKIDPLKPINLGFREHIDSAIRRDLGGYQEKRWEQPGSE